MITSRDLKYEIGQLTDIVENKEYTIMERAQLKAQLLIIKLLLNVRTNQVTDLKNRGVISPTERVEVRD